MTDVVYLMGAGASFGKRAQDVLSHKVEIIKGDTSKEKTLLFKVLDNDKIDLIVSKLTK